MRAWVHLIGALVAVVASGVVVTWLVGRDGSLLWTGLWCLAVAVFLFFWNFERDALFADDWVEAGQVAACLTFVAAGLALIATHRIG